MYLFGGKRDRPSSKDYDLLLISDDFEGMSRQKRIEKVLLNFKSENVDPVCLTVEEYHRLLKQKSNFLNVILTNSDKIYERQSD